MITASRVLHITQTEVSGFSLSVLLSRFRRADWRRINCLHSDPGLQTHVAVFANSKVRSVQGRICTSRPFTDLVPRMIVLIIMDNLPRRRCDERLQPLNVCRYYYTVRDPTQNSSWGLVCGILEGGGSRKVYQKPECLSRVEIEKQESTYRPCCSDHRTHTLEFEPLSPYVHERGLLHSHQIHITM
jgi:hypothetical protein